MKIPIVLVVAFAVCGCSEKQLDSAGKQLGSAGSSIASSAPGAANDALIVAQIEGALVTTDADSALHVAVSSHDGAVSLTGKVKSDAIGAEFVEKAKAISGVKTFTATLKADPHLSSAKDQASDFALVASVQAGIAGQAGINALKVHVAAHAGTVTLSGTVATDALRSTIVAAAKSASGVRDVVDHLTVGS